MPGFPNSVIKRCRKIFLICSQFESLSSLRAFFVVDELSPFRDGLRNADTKEALVDKNLEYFIEQKLRGGVSLLHVVLQILVDRYDEVTEVHEELIEIQKVLQVNLSKSYQGNNIGIQSSYKVFDYLFRFDFSAQVKLFKSIIDKYDTAAFLVHGPPEFGQRTLSKRLSTLLPKWGNGIHISIEATSNGIGRRSESFWRDFARRLDMPPDTDPKKLAEKVCQWKDSQDVIIVIHTVDYFEELTLSSYIEDFWKVIYIAAQKVEKVIPPKTHLLLFLVDYDGKVCNMAKKHQIFSEIPENVASSHLPLILPVNQEFPEILLDSWFDSVIEFLPSHPNIKDVLNDTKGVPDRVFEKVYSICGVDWEGEVIP